MKMGLLKTVKEYSESSTVHGVGYIFASGQHVLERLLWVLVVLVGISLATFFSVEAYLAWGDFPVITSVSTTALPIEDLAWPSVTLCNQGRGIGATDRVYRVQLAEYVKKKGKDIKDLNDVQIREEEMEFLQESYPGLGESPTKLVSAMTSSTPDSVVEADVIAGDLFECAEQLSTTTPTTTTTTSSTTTTIGTTNTITNQPTTKDLNDECKEDHTSWEHSGGKS